MGKTTIPWCHYTFNPWIGCTEIRPECANCYAKARDRRHLIERVDHWGPTAPRYITADDYWKKPERWNRKAAENGERYRVFCGSQMDWAERHEDPTMAAMLDALRERLFSLIDATPNLDWLLLTKRAENIAPLLPTRYRRAYRGDTPNIWLGTSAGTQSTANIALPELEKFAYVAPLLFVSAEPLLEYTNLRPWLARGGIGWVIVGAESGPRARPMDEDDVRIMRDDCAEFGVPFFYKQRLEDGTKIELPELDGRRWAEFPATPNPNPEPE